MLKRFFQIPAQIGLRHPLAALAFGGVVFCFGVLFTGRLRMLENADTKRFDDSEVLQAFHDVAKYFSANEYIMVVIEGREFDQEFQLKALAEVFARRVEDSRFLSQVAWKTNQLYLARHFEGDFPGIVNYLTRDDWRAINDKLKPQNIQKSLGVLRSPRLGGVDPLLRDDPLQILSPVKKRLENALTPTATTVRDGYFMAESAPMVALFLRPVGDSRDVSFCLELMEFLNKTREITERDVELTRNVKIHLVGAHARVASEYHVLRRDFTRAAIITFVLVSALLLFSYRRAFAFISIGLPVIVSLAFLLGFSGGVFGYISLATMSGIALAMTAAVAFAVYIHDRYIELAPLSPQKLDGALNQAAVSGVGAFSLVVLATTASFAFAALSPFDEIRTMAIIVIVGAAAVFVFTYLLAPAAIRLIAVPSKRRSISLHFSTFGMRHMAWGALAYPRAWLALVVLLTCYLSFHASRLEYQHEPSTFGYPDAEYVGSYDRVSRHFPLPLSQTMFLLRAENMESLLRKNDALYDILWEEKERCDIQSIISLRNILPSMESQVASRRIALESTEWNEEILTRRLKEAASEAEMKFEPLFGAFFETVNSIKLYAAQGAYSRWGDIRDASAVQSVRKHLMRDRGGCLAMTQVFASGDQWENSVPESLMSRLREKFPDIQVTSRAMLLKLRGDELRRSAVIGVVIQFLAMILFLMLVFKRLRVALILIAPIGLTILWTAGYMAIIEIPLGIGPLALAPIFITLTLINTLQFFCRLVDSVGSAELRSPDLFQFAYRAIERSGRPMTVINSIILIGGASLLISDHYGVHDIGIVAVVASVFSLISTLAVLPCITLLLGPIDSKWSDLAAMDSPNRAQLYQETFGAPGAPRSEANTERLG